MTWRRIAVVCLLVGLAGYHAVLFRVAGFEVTLAAVMLVPVVGLVAIFGRFRPGWIVGAAAVGCIAMSQAFVAEALTEFVKSIAQIGVFALTVVAGLSLRLSDEDRRFLARGVLLMGGLIACIVVAQTLFGPGPGRVLAVPLGPLAPLGPGNEVYDPFSFGGLPRPQAVFSEPSVAGWFLAWCVAVGLAYSARAGRVWLVPTVAAGVGSFLSLSLSGIACLLGVLATYGLRPGGRFGRGARVLTAGLVVAGIVYLQRDVALVRWDQLAVAGTSTYYRVMAPLLLLQESLPQYPLGHPLGDVTWIEQQSFMINWERGSQTNIDNTWLQGAYYFGWLGILGVALVGGYVFRETVKGEAHAVILVAFFLALAATGAGFTPNGGLLAAATLALRFPPRVGNSST